MADDSSTSMAILFKKAHAGDKDATGEVVKRMQGDLRPIAEKFMKNERSSHTFSPSDLIGNLLLKYLKSGMPDTDNRLSFAALAANAMREVLVDHARNKNADKRGRGAKKVSLDLAQIGDRVDIPDGFDIEVLDEVLDRLKAFNERWFRIVELRFFGGFTIEQTAEVLQVSTKTVSNDWNRASAWIKARMSSDEFK